MRVLLLFFLLVPLWAKVNVVTSIPDIADITKNIGRDSVAVFSLAKGTEDMHQVRARSSFLPILNKADLVMSLGLWAEKQWLPNLVRSARNRKIQPDSEGWIEVYEGLEILEKPVDSLTRAMAGHHGKGNPHYNNSPYAGKYMAQNIYKALIRVDPLGEPFYKKNLDLYLKKLAFMEKKLKEKGAPLKGVSVISYHADLAYFCDFYEMRITGTLEAKPGVAPNSKHLAQLVGKSRRDKTALILYHQAQNPKLPKVIARKIGAEAVCFANMVRSRPEIKNYFQLQEYNLNLMLKALKKVDQ